MGKYRQIIKYYSVYVGIKCFILLSGGIFVCHGTWSGEHSLYVLTKEMLRGLEH